MGTAMNDDESPGNTRRKVVLDAAIEAASRHGYKNITRDGVALAAGVAAGSVNHAFGTMAQLRNEVMREAVRLGRTEIIAQGLADGHTLARAAPPQLRKKAALALA